MQKDLTADFFKGAALATLSPLGFKVDAVRAARGLEAARLVRAGSNAIVLLFGVVLARHEPVVELVVHFALVERKRGGVHDPHRPLARRVWVVASARHQSQPHAARRGRRSHGGKERGRRATGQAQQAAILGPAVALVRAVA